MREGEGEGSREKGEGERASRWRVDEGEGWVVNGGGSVHEKVRNRVCMILVSILVVQRYRWKKFSPKFAIKGLVVPLIFFLFSNPNPNSTP